MRIVHFHPSDRNFGDDLNLCIWRKLLKPAVWSVPDAAIVGIGTILNTDRLNAATIPDSRLFVLGSGAGYGRPPDRDMLKRMTFLCVRGPLTAKLLELPPQTAATDGAALLATLPGNTQRSDAADVLFIPHVSSAISSDWKMACQHAGVRYIDPRSSVDSVLEAIRGARLVLTEAMHGAIFADTMRVPWVPIATSRRILGFKWQDWTRSLGLSYSPSSLAPPSALRAISFLKQRVLHKKSTESSGSSDKDESIVHHYRAKCELSNQPHSKSTILTRAGKERLMRVLDPVFVDHAARSLCRLTTARSFLSEDRLFSIKLEQLESGRYAVERGLLA